MNGLNSVNKFCQFTSIFLIVLLITPIVLSNILDEELCNYSICENTNEEERDSEPEEDEQKRELQEFLSGSSIKQDVLFSNNKFHFFNSCFLSNIRKEILTPPPDRV